MEENEKNEGKSGRKKAIKTFAIIFVVVLLLLTFFSNTIMNYSLPEVSTTTVSSGSVSQKVRCQGNVETAKDVEVTVSGERIVKEVLVESGDEVKKGQTLVTFNEAENPELKKAEEELKDMEREQEKALLTMGKDYTEEYIEIEKLRQAITDAEQALNEARAAEAASNTAKANAEELNNKINNQSVIVNELQAQFDTYAELVNYNVIVESISEKKDASDKLQIDIDNLNAKIAELEKQIGEKAAQPVPEGETTEPDTETEEETDEQKLERLKEELQEKTTEKTSLDEEINTLSAEIADVVTIADKLAEEKAKLENLKAQAESGSGEGSTVTSVKEAEATLKTAQESYDSKLRAFEKTKEQDYLEQQKDEIDNKKKMEELEEKRKEVEKLKDQDDTAAIVAPADGIITGITIKEGDKVTNENPLATIQLAESGYEVSATIPKSDGQLIHVGDSAYLENVWSPDAEATVKSIKPDTNDPNKNLVVKFEVKGSDISVGQTIQFAVGEKSQKYDCIVPNNAVKEDTKGNFVLVVKVKSTPLGNRYVVKKVEVKKLASDTTKCAISGDVAEYDNIVTNSTKRLENGQQVRLSEKQ